MNRSNLEPAHKDCNSEKGGPTIFDSIAPQPIGKRPDHGPSEKCTQNLPKAQ
jgi:hypothetical protein